MSAGLALFDYDNDLDLDIYLLSGAPIDASEPSSWQSNQLYRNDGGFKFTDVSKEAGVDDDGFGLGVACADFDNDGFVDLYLNNFGANILYHNNGDGTFDDVTESARAANGTKVGGGASFLDIDQDGDLDLYVANYIQLDVQSHKVHIHKGLPSYPSPLQFEPEADTLLLNNGNGVFSDVSVESGIRDVAGRSMGVATFDYEADGDTDIYVANDSQENHLFVNDGKGKFLESALIAGLAMDYQGKHQASMGVEVVDVNGDTHQDLVVTSFSEEFVTL